VLEVLFNSSNDKLARMSAYLGEKLSTLTLLKAHSIVIEDKSTDDSARIMTLIRDFLMEEGQNDFEFTVTGDKITIRALTDEAKSWANRLGSPTGLPPGLHQCLHCGKIFTSNEEYRAHVIIHYA
jgi:hypothetical protein